VRRADTAQRILALVTTQEGAAAVVGDLLEEVSESHLFWLAVAHTALAFGWRNVLRFMSGRHPVFSESDIMAPVINTWRFMWSRKWLVLVPVVLFTTVASLVAYSRPIRYRSEALILVVPQRVPESFVRSTVTQRIEDRLLSIAQTILSRSQLERIITELDLYADERQRGAIMEDVVEQMRTRDITTTKTDKGDAFRIAYTGPNKRVVKEVTEKLTSLFISENVRNRGNLADGTIQFLEASLEEFRRDLDESDEAIKEAQLAKRPLRRSDVVTNEELEKMFRLTFAKVRDAKTAANLERRQIGEQFQLLEPPRIPTRPIGLDRREIFLVGATGGLTLGLILMLAAATRRPPPATGSSAVTVP
jgi:uncharacterized protein involved in exopolysaccharide biosynthesis